MQALWPSTRQCTVCCLGPVTLPSPHSLLFGPCHLTFASWFVAWALLPCLSLMPRRSSSVKPAPQMQHVPPSRLCWSCMRTFRPQLTCVIIRINGLLLVAHLIISLPQDKFKARLLNVFVLVQ